MFLLKTYVCIKKKTWWSQFFKIKNKKNLSCLSENELEYWNVEEFDLIYLSLFSNVITIKCTLKSVKIDGTFSLKFSCYFLNIYIFVHLFTDY